MLAALLNGPRADAVLTPLVQFLTDECQKKGLAHTNAVVLVDWCSVLLLHLARSPARWANHGLDVVRADARVLETCVGAGSDRRAERIARAALVSTRRALRAIFRAEPAALPQLVTTLTAKSAVPTPANAVFLGVIAGVASRLSIAKSLLEQHKHDYYTYHVREIIGSRSQLPGHIANALHDFFHNFPTLEELRKELIAPVEKALLRAPEVVLNDLVSPMILALPESMDLSDILLENMLKPLLSNLKSSNPTIRAGALRTFIALASRSHQEDSLGRVADEVLNPLKQGKVSGVDQKVLHAQMLSALPPRTSLSTKIPPGLAPVALKEPSETAVVAQVSAMTQHLNFGLANGVSLDKTVSDAFIKGMSDKRVPVKRLWSIRTADIWWNLSEAQFAQPVVLEFCQATLPKLVEIWQEVNANPVPSTQNGMFTVGHYVVALLIEKARHISDEKLVAIFEKSDVISQSFTTQPKPSFILNPKVYAKLSTEDDVAVALRALTALAPFLGHDISTDAQDAWAQAFIYLIVAQSVATKAKSAAKHALTQSYLRSSPERISNIIVKGIWSWYKSTVQENKDSAAFSAKSGTAELGHVLGCICLPLDTQSKLDVRVDASCLNQQALSLIVLARPEIIPRVSWIDLTLRMGIDPGQLVRDNLNDLMDMINNVTEVRDAQYK